MVKFVVKFKILLELLPHDWFYFVLFHILINGHRNVELTGESHGANELHYWTLLPQLFMCAVFGFGLAEILFLTLITRNTYFKKVEFDLIKNPTC